MLRAATYEVAHKHLILWLSPNMWGVRNCKSEKQARELIKASGVAQELHIEKDPRKCLKENASC